MLKPTVRRATVIALLVSLVIAAGLWFLIGYGTLKVSQHVVKKVDSLPHGPRPEPARIANLQ